MEVFRPRADFREVTEEAREVGEDIVDSDSGEFGFWMRRAER